MNNLLNEEIERMQVLAGIKASNETFESVLREFIEVIDEHEYSLMEETLNESLWEKTKYYLGKLGRYKVNGKFWGKNKELEASRKRIDDLLAKEANTKIKELIQNIKKYNPEFPNNESADSFLDTCLHIAKLYDSVIAATKKDSNNEDFMPIDMANEIINDLREYVKHTLDAELKSSYTTFNEAEGDNSIGDIENYDKRAKKDLLKRRAGKDEFTSERMKTLKSWRLPLSLFGVGGALGGLSWLLDLLQNKADLIHVLKGEGMTQILNRAGERGGWGLPKLGSDSPLSDVQKYISKVGEGDYKLGLDRLTADNGMFQDPGAAREALAQMGSENQGTTAGDFFQNKLAGTGKMPGDMLVTKALGPLLLKQGAKAVAPWLGKFASGLGVALVAGSVAVALARLKGKNSSRAATLNSLYQSLKNIKPTEENPTVVPVENTPGGEDRFQPTGDQSPTTPTNLTNPKTGDVKVVKSDFDKNTAVKTALGKIDTADEFRELILQMSQFVSANLRKDKANLKAALYAIANQLKSKMKKSVQEDYSLPADAENASKAIQAAKTLAQHLGNINTREEFVELLFQVLPLIDPQGKITQDKTRLVNIVYGAANKIDKFVDDKHKENPATKPGGLS
jgi:hypothetical protein